jgi:hypothetical protein
MCVLPILLMTSSTEGTGQRGAPVAHQAGWRPPGLIWLPHSRVVILLGSVFISQNMPDDVHHSKKPEHVAVAATDDRQPQILLVDSHFDALLAKQRARNVLHNDRLHPTAMSLSRSSSPRRPAPCPTITPRRRVRHRDRQAITNDLLRSAVTDLEDELILHIKKRRKLGTAQQSPPRKFLRNDGRVVTTNLRVFQRATWLYHSWTSL